MNFFLPSPFAVNVTGLSKFVGHFLLHVQFFYLEFLYVPSKVLFFYNLSSWYTFFTWDVQFFIWYRASLLGHRGFTVSVLTGGGMFLGEVPASCLGSPSLVADCATKSTTSNMYFIRTDWCLLWTVVLWIGWYKIYKFWHGRKSGHDQNLAKTLIFGCYKVNRAKIPFQLSGHMYR